MNSLAKVGCALAALGLVGCGSVAEAPGQKQLSAEVGQVRSQLGSLEASLNKSAKQIDELTALAQANQVQLRQLAKKSVEQAAAPAAAAAPEAPVAASADPAVRRALFRENIREFFAQSGGDLLLPVDDLPPVVLETIQETIPGLELTEVEQRRRGEGVEFDVRGTLGKKKFRLRIAADGTVLDAELPPDQAPQIVWDAASQTIPGIVLTEVRQKRRGGRVEFDVRGKLGNKKFKLRIGADGTVLEAELPLELAPQPVRDAASQTIPGIKLASVKQKRRGERVEFEVRGKLGKKKLKLLIAADGTVLEAELPLDQTPQIIWDAVAEAIPGIELTAVEQRQDDEGVYYCLRGRVGKKKSHLHLNADGTVR